MARSAAMRAPLVSLAVVLLLASVAAAMQADQQAAQLQQPTTRTLHGRVLDAHLQPLAKAEVRSGTAEQLDSATPPAPVATTDAAGSFTITVPANEPPRLRVSAAGATTAVWDQNPNHGYPGVWSPAVELSVSSIDLPTLVLEAARPVQGRVRDQHGKPVAGALIEAEDLIAGWSLGQPWRLRDTARSDASGIFVLRGTPPQALRLRVQAPGCYTHSLAPVDAGSPLDISLLPSGFLAGTVVGADGKPVAARVTVAYEGFGQEELQAADGAFRTTWRHPSHCRVRATTATARPLVDPFSFAQGIAPPAVPSGESETITAPREDLRIIVALPPPPTAVLEVRVVDEQGKAITGFRAAVAWSGSDQTDVQIQDWLAFQGVAAVEGTAALRAPQTEQGEQTDGIVGLSAPGRALTVAKATWEPRTEGGGVELQVTMSPGIEVRGTVQDADGKPVAGATVWTSRTQPNQVAWGTSPRTDTVRSQDDGSFLLDFLGEGTWYFQASPGATGPASTPRRVRIGKEPVPAVTIKLPRIVDVKGHVEGALPPGAMLMLNESKAGYSMFGDPGGRPVRLDADGSFTLSAQVVGSKSFTLCIPQSTRSGSQLALQCSSVRVTADSTEVTVRPRERTGRVQGRVKFNETRVPPLRLVACAGVKTDTQLLQYAQEISSPVNLDGTFELMLPTTTRQLRLRDALTGMALCEDVECTVEADKVKQVELTAEVGELRLKLESEDAGLGGPGVRLHLQNGEQPANPWWILGNLGSGLDLRDAAGEVTLYLKPGQTTLRLQRGTMAAEQAQVIVFGGGPEGEVLEELDVRPGKLHEVTLKIPRRQVGGR